MEETQHIYLYMDDSGKLTKNEECVFYGGLAFINKKDKDDFERQYRIIRNRAKCRYPYCRQNKKVCNSNCPELKSSNLQGRDRRQFMRLILKEITYFVRVENKELKYVDFNNSLNVGRYQEYAQKIAIKKICEKLIATGKIVLGKPIKIEIYIDQDNHISNSKYPFNINIKKELLDGWDKPSHYNSGMYHITGPFEQCKELVNIDCKLNIESHLNIGVQASDILVGTYRQYRIHDKNKFINYCSKITSPAKLP